MPFEELDPASLCPMDREGVEFIRAFNRMTGHNVVPLKIHKDDWKAWLPAMGWAWVRFQQLAHQQYAANKGLSRGRRRPGMV